MRRLLAVVALLGGLVAAPAAAQSPPPRGPAPVMPTKVPARTGLEVVVIEASRDGQRVDPALTKLAGQLSRTGFTSFRHVDTQRFKVPDGRAVRVDVPDGHEVTLTVRGHDARMAHLTVTSRKPGGEPVDLEHSVAWDRAVLWAFKTGRPGRAWLLMVHVRD